MSEVTDLALEFGFVTPYTSLFVELPEKTNPYPRETENGVFEEKTTVGTETGMPVADAVKDETSADNSMSSPLSGQSEPAPGQSKSTFTHSKSTSSQAEPASDQSKSASGGSADASSDISSVSTQSAHYEGADVSAQSQGSSEKAGKEKTPGFEILLAVSGFLGTAILFRKK